jgi:cell division protein FtsB
MKNFQHKNSFRQVLESKPFLILLSFIALAFIWGVISFVGKMEETIKNKKIANSKLEELKQEKAKLSSDIAKLNTPEGVEASIREKFGYAKEGEGLIVVVDDKDKSAAETTPKHNLFVEFFVKMFK